MLVYGNNINEDNVKCCFFGPLDCRHAHTHHLIVLPFLVGCFSKILEQIFTGMMPTDSVDVLKAVVICGDG